MLTVPPRSVGSLVVYGLLQERIMTQPYGSSSSSQSSGETFQHSVFLVLCNRTVRALPYAFTLSLSLFPNRSLPSACSSLTRYL